jgi:hypothetical protein
MLTWTDHLKPNYPKGCGYDHKDAEYEGLLFRIWWKSWKDIPEEGRMDTRGLDLNGHFLGEYYSELEAMEAAEKWLSNPMGMLKTVLFLDYR